MANLSKTELSERRQILFRLLAGARLISRKPKAAPTVTPVADPAAYPWMANADTFVFAS